MEELKSQLKKVGSEILVSAQEAIYRLLSLPMKQLNKFVVLVDSNPKNERIAAFSWVLRYVCLGL